MKKLILSLVAIATISLSSFGQAPEGFKYQAVVRDAGNTILNNQAVGMRMTIQQGSIGGTAVYTETFTPTTNGYGLVNLEIGSGTLVSGDFTTIDWANGPFFMETAVDVTGGTSYAVMGTSQLMSVPYALYAKTSGNGAGPQGPAGNDGIDGVDGAIGATGPQGPIGNDGAVGATGPQGPIGNDGAVGATGPQGPTGPAGVDGQGGVTTAGTGINVTGAGTVVSPYVVSTTSPCGLAIGQTYQGGIIFYLDASGCHGLISATTDQSTGIVWWNGSYTDTYASGSGLFDGDGNCYRIRRSQGDCVSCNAAELCLDLNLGGYSDWYLPSKYELNLMYRNIGQGNALGLGNVGGFASNFYWSSTEFGFSNAWFQDFGSGYQYNFYVKSNFNNVRSVRAF
ncbi:DUF1566 domain-containing protein [Crocinitomicaceae bacterium]|nr:DUF1566 domain-containing protein [Crocinitomicaceae bacterium]